MGPLKALSEQHETFLLRYLFHGNATRAYREAGYAPKNADSNAWRLMADPLIKRRLAELRAEKFKALHMDADEILARAAMIARADMRQCYDEAGRLLNPAELSEEAAVALAGLDVLEEWDGTGAKRKVIGYTKKVRLRDPMPAIRLLAEHKKLVKQPGDVSDALAQIAEGLKLARARRRAKEQQP